MANKPERPEAKKAPNTEVIELYDRAYINIMTLQGQIEVLRATAAYKAISEITEDALEFYCYDMLSRIESARGDLDKLYNLCTGNS